MCTRARNVLRNRPQCGFDPLKTAGLGCSLAVALLLGGCLGNTSRVTTSPLDIVPVDETGQWTNYAVTQKEALLAKSDFSVDIIRFTDLRRPRSLEIENPDQLVAYYEPDTLLHGVSTQVPALLNKYLAYRPKKEKHYKVEITLKRMKTLIETGTFWSGTWGRYVTDVDLEVVVRRPDSRVVLAKHYLAYKEQPRKGEGGYGPSKERDRSRLFDLTETSLREISTNIGWDIRQLDARHWNVAKDKPAIVADMGGVTPTVPAVMPAVATDKVMDVPAPVQGQVEIVPVSETQVLTSATLPPSAWPDWLQKAGVQAF